MKNSLINPISYDTATATGLMKKSNKISMFSHFGGQIILGPSVVRSLRAKMTKKLNFRISKILSEK